MLLNERKILIAGFLMILLVTGCSTPPRKIDTGDIPMPAPRVVQKTPGSIWGGENIRNRFFADFRARDVGDTLKITISEDTKATESAKTTTTRATSMDASITNLFGMPLNFGAKNFLNQGNAFSPTLKGGHSNSFAGDGSTERKGTITASITARVTKVLPNGNMFVEGRKETMINKEQQYIILSGIVRNEDITASNTVSSDNVADLRIELSGYGVINDKQSPGWLTRLVDKGWPF